MFNMISNAHKCILKSVMSCCMRNYRVLSALANNFEVLNTLLYFSRKRIQILEHIDTYQQSA